VVAPAAVAVAEAVAAEAGAAAAPPLPALSVLVVDDDEFNVAFVKGGLPSPPLTVASAINGRAALEAARLGAYDVVLMDLEMPVMNGFEALKGLRALEAAEGRARSKVVAFSSYDDDSIRRRCAEAGFDAYLSKPAPRERIHDILRAVAAGGALPEPPVAAAAAQGAPGPDDPVAVDEELRPALGRFLETRRALLEELAGALRDGDREQARRLAHKLAGSFALYGFRWASEESRALQRGAAAGDLAALAERCEALRAHLENVKLAQGDADGRTAQAAAG